MQKKIFVLMSMAILLVGCLGPPKEVPVAPLPEPAEPPSSLLIEHFDQAVAEHSCMEAMDYKNRLFRGSSSFSSARARTYILTKLCLCHLEAGDDLELFKRCYTELKENATKLSYFPRETQFVLELGHQITEQGPSTDHRINPAIREAFITIFGKGGESK